MESPLMNCDRENDTSRKRQRNVGRQAEPTRSLKKTKNTNELALMSREQLAEIIGAPAGEGSLQELQSRLLLQKSKVIYGRTRYNEEDDNFSRVCGLVGQPTLEMAVGSLETNRGKLGYNIHMVVYRGELVDMRSSVGSFLVTKEDLKEPFFVLDSDMYAYLDYTIPESLFRGTALRQLREVSCRDCDILLRLLKADPCRLECILFEALDGSLPNVRRHIVTAINQLPSLKKIYYPPHWLKLAECRHLTSIRGCVLAALPPSLTDLGCIRVTAPVQQMTRLTSLDVLYAPACLVQLTQLRRLSVRYPDTISDQVRLPNLEELSLGRTDEKITRLLMAGCFGTTLCTLNMGCWRAPLPGLGRLFPLLHTIEFSGGCHLIESVPLPPLHSLGIFHADEELLRAFESGLLTRLEHIKCSHCNGDEMGPLFQMQSITSLEFVFPRALDWLDQVAQATHLQRLEVVLVSSSSVTEEQAVRLARLIGEHPSLCHFKLAPGGHSWSTFKKESDLRLLRANPRLSLPLVDRWVMKDRKKSMRAFLLVNRRLARRNSPWLTMDILRNCIYPLLMSIPVDVSEMTEW